MLTGFNGVVLAADMLEYQDKAGLIKIIGSFSYKTHTVSHVPMLFLNECSRPLS